MEKLRLWILRAMVVVMSLVAIGGLLVATQTDKPYDERSYLLILSLFALLLSWR